MGGKRGVRETQVLSIFSSFVLAASEAGPADFWQHRWVQNTRHDKNATAALLRPRLGGTFAGSCRQFGRRCRGGAGVVRAAAAAAPADGVRGRGFGVPGIGGEGILPGNVCIAMLFNQCIFFKKKVFLPFFCLESPWMTAPRPLKRT